MTGMTRTTIKVTHDQKVAALRGLFARPGSPQIGPYRPAKDRTEREPNGKAHRTR